MQASGSRVSEVFGAANAREKMDVVQGEWRLAPRPQDTVRGGDDQCRRDEGPGALAGGSVAADIDLTNCVPWRATLDERPAIIGTDDSRAEIFASGGGAGHRNRGRGEQARQDPH